MHCAGDGADRADQRRLRSASQRRGSSGRVPVILPAIRDRASPNQGCRGTPPRIDMLVLHYTGMATAAAALDRLCDPTARVSAHYVVEESGIIWRLVSETRRG